MSKFKISLKIGAKKYFATVKALNSFDAKMKVMGAAKRKYPNAEIKLESILPYEDPIGKILDNLEKILKSK